MDRKRLLFIVAFALSVIVIGWLLYALFFAPSQGPTQPGNQNVNGSLPVPGNGNISVVPNTNTQPQLPGFGSQIDIMAPTDVAQGGLTKVVDYGDVAVQDFMAGPTGPLYYDKSAARFFKLDGTTAVALSDSKFFNVEKVTWSRNQDKAILEYPDGSNIVYDFSTNKQVTLPKELEDFSFDTQGKQIAGKWIGKTKDENWLMVGDADGSNLRLIEPLGDRAYNVSVGFSPNSQMVAMVRRPADANTQAILPIGLHGENFQEFKVEGLKFESKWSPTGSSLLYNVATTDSNYNPQLWLTTGTTETLGSSHLDLRLSTSVDKCTFDSTGSSLYCAEATSLPRGSGLYPELAQGSADAFYRIDLRSGQKVPLALPVGSQATYSAQSLSLSSDGSLLYFVDATTKRLHSIRLK